MKAGRRTLLCWIHPPPITTTLVCCSLLLLRLFPYPSLPHSNPIRYNALQRHTQWHCSRITLAASATSLTSEGSEDAKRLHRKEKKKCVLLCPTSFICSFFYNIDGRTINGSSKRMSWCAEAAVCWRARFPPVHTARNTLNTSASSAATWPLGSAYVLFGFSPLLFIPFIFSSLVCNSGARHTSAVRGIFLFLLSPLLILMLLSFARGLVGDRRFLVCCAFSLPFCLNLILLSYLCVCCAATRSRRVEIT